MSSTRPGYILRINSDEWVEQIFELKKYYSGVMRSWGTGTPILLAKKSEEGDSFLGYGVTDRVEMLWEMPPEEKNYCRENGWKCALTFKPLIYFNEPLPIKETILADDKRRGSFLHGALLKEDQVDSILAEAESRQKK
jgi:hypothetical protein